jgi:hypothetical protein
MLSRFVRMRQALWTYSYWRRSTPRFIQVKTGAGNL